MTAATGGPADGHDLAWYKAHLKDAAKEVDYCKGQYMGPNATKADLEKMPNYCRFAHGALAALDVWASSAVDCKVDPMVCPLTKTFAEGIDTGSPEAQEALARMTALHIKTSH